MIIETPPIYEPVIKRFVALLKSEYLAHAYLFIGSASSGKSETALAIAKLINCEQKSKGTFCDECAACLKINKTSHPDVHVVTKLEDEDSIKIEQIRDLIYGAQLKPFESAKKIFIIKDIQDLTIEASNALLKTLEEPTPNSLLLLTSSFPERVLDTIKSRCHVIQFFPLASDELEGQLIKNYRLPKDAAHFLAYFSDGCLGKAVNLGDNKIFERKNEVINNFVFMRNSEPYLQGLIGEKEKIKEALDILLTWFRDLMLVKAGIEEIRLINFDRAKDLKKLETKYTFAELEAALKEIINTSKLLEDNLNMKIALTLIKERLWRK